MLIAKSSPQPHEHKIDLRTRTGALRILIADDHDIIRRGLRQLLTSQPGWEICAEAKTGREAVSLAEQFKPEIVVHSSRVKTLWRSIQRGKGHPAD